MLTKRGAIALQLLLQFKTLLQRILIWLERAGVYVELIQIVVFTFQVNQLATATGVATATAIQVISAGKLPATSIAIIIGIVVGSRRRSSRCRVAVIIGAAGGGGSRGGGSVR